MFNFRKILAVLLICPAIAGISQAQVFVIGTGFGTDCYNKTANAYASFLDAEQTCTRALREETMTAKNRAATYVNRGVLRMRAGKYEESLTDYADAIALNPDLAEAYLNKGSVYIYQRDFVSALAPINKSLELGITDAHAAYYNRGIARENTGDINGAYNDYARALELKPDWDLAIMQLDRFEIAPVD